MNKSLIIGTLIGMCSFMASCHRSDPSDMENSPQTDSDSIRTLCEISTWRCVYSPTGRQQCQSDGSWGLLELCDLCVGQGDCRSFECNANKITCEDGVLKTCNTIGDGYEQQSPCLSGACNESGDACLDDGCKPGIWRCVESPTGRQQCEADGTWGSTESCDICVDEGDCRTQVCTAGETTCNGDLLQQCNDLGDAYDWEVICPSGICDDVNDECEICVAGETKCVDGGTSLYECSTDGQEATVTECPGSVCYGAGSCLACQSTDGFECDGNRQWRFECANGEVVGQTDCWAEDKTCDNAQCRGECVWGKYRCNNSISEKCDPMGLWQEDDVCVWPSRVCEVDPLVPEYGQCITNSPYNLGFDSTGATYPLGNSLVYATRIQVTDLSVLLELAFVTPSSGGQARLALYEDSIDSATGWVAPGNRLLIAVGEINPVQSANPNRLVIDARDMNPGEYYWVAIQADSTSIYGRSVPGSRVWLTLDVYDFGDFPNPFPNGFYCDVVDNTEYSVYATVQNYP